jgi:wyosine [tRNA(Phe)-imidazoG37] synthetase (radical SAM superfamily)
MSNKEEVTKRAILQELNSCDEMIKQTLEGIKKLRLQFAHIKAIQRVLQIYCDKTGIDY